MFNVSILSIWSGCFSPTPRLLLPIDPKCCGSLGSSPRCGVDHCQALEEMQPEEQSFYRSQVSQCDFSDVRARKSIFCVFGAFSLEYPHQLWILLCGFCIFWASRPVYMIFLDIDDHVVTTSSKIGSSREKWAALVGLVVTGMVGKRWQRKIPSEPPPCRES